MGRFVKNRSLEGWDHATRLQYGTSSTRPLHPTNGLIRYNTDNSLVEVYYGGVWNSIAKVGNVVVVKDSQGASAPGSNLAVADGIITEFTMSSAYDSGEETQVLVYVGNVFQNPGVAYTFDGSTTITFTSPPPSGHTIVILHNLTSTNAV